MKKIRSYAYSIIQGAVFLLSLFTSFYYPLLLILSVTALLSALDKFGKGIILRELIALHTCVVCLVFPMIGYEWYPKSNELARLWVKYMLINSDVYFNFALPAVAAFVFAISWPIGHNDEGQKMESHLDIIKKILLEKKDMAIYLMITGIISSFVGPFLPEALSYVSTLLFWGSFAAFLYIYLNPKIKHRIPILVVFVIFILQRSLAQGMFTVVAYMSITIFSFLYVGKKSALWKKLAIFVVGFFILFIIQSVKGTYRKYTWLSDYQGSRAVLFISLIAEKVSEPSALFDNAAFFPVYVRGNQGFNVALVMRRFPALKSFDYGNNLFTIVAASVVPRFLWPDKPQAGGKFNMQYYTGITLRSGWSTNVGPLGEAYGSFGVAGGIAYMFFIGLFIRWSYYMVFKVSGKIPLLLCWIPVLFYQVTYSMETDTLQILNTLIKGSFFLWLVYKFIPSWLGIDKKNKQVSHKSYRDRQLQTG